MYRVLGLATSMIVVLAVAQAGAAEGKTTEPPQLRALREEAQRGNPEAQHELGYRYQTGQGVAKDLAKAVEWYERAAEAGDAESENNLGVAYSSGEGVPQDFQKALGWFRKAAAHGSVRGYYNLGRMFDQGFGVKKDDQDAEKWFRRAIEFGDLDAMLDFGRLLAARGDDQQAYMFLDLARFYSKDSDRRNQAQGELAKLLQRISQKQLLAARRAGQDWSAARVLVENLEKAAGKALADGDFGRARTLFSQALDAARTKDLGPDKISRLTYGLAQATSKTGESDRAAELLEQAVKAEEDVSGPESAETTARIFELAELQHAQGHDDKAAATYERALANAAKIRLEITDPEGLAGRMEEYAAVLEASGKAGEAKKARAEAKRVRGAVPGVQAPGG